MLKKIAAVVVMVLFCCGQIALAAPPPAVQKELPLVKTAKQYLGVKYTFGGSTPKGFDCSGYVQYVYGKHNKKLPRTADIQYTVGKPVTKTTELKPGDLVFFATGKAKEINHVGIYIGKNEFINAQTSKGVAIARLDNPYWKPRYLGAKRVL